jgi:N6-adenosine-specific RNA methylase IME4
VQSNHTPCRVLLADAPWGFKDKLPGKKRGAEKHYKCMTLSEIMRMPLPAIHVNAVLFMWRVSSMVEEAYQVVRAWGFVPKSEIVWNKTSEDGERDAIGMGRIVRGSHETCIVATRGRLVPVSKSERTSFRAPRTKHSEKPEEFYRIVERLYPLELWPGGHVELFARKRRRGWIQFGDELPPDPARGSWLATTLAMELERRRETPPLKSVGEEPGEVSDAGLSAPAGPA